MLCARHPLPTLAPLALFALPLLVLACGPETTSAPTVPSSSVKPSAEPGPEAAASRPTGAGDAGATSIKTLFVRETRVDCEGEGPQKCLQVRGSATEEWTLFYSAIQGFEYEEGTRYELKVAVEDAPRPPADGSSRAYKLVEVVSREKVRGGAP